MSLKETLKMSLVTEEKYLKITKKQLVQGRA